MKKYSQKELLNEGLWDGIKKVGGAVASGAKAFGRGADYIIGKAAPEVQKLYKDPYNAAVGLKNAVMGNTTTNPKEGKVVPQQILNSIRTGLQRTGNKLSFKPIKYYTYSKELKKDVYGATIIDATTNKEQLVYVDKNGVILTP